MDQSLSNTPAIPLDTIAEALGKLGYPLNGRMDAAKRMSWVPALAADMIEYANMGAPKFDPQTGQLPQVLQRQLNDGYTVASLMTDFLQEPVGAFLLGAALVTHYDEAIGMLEKMVIDGISIRRPDGSYANMSVPASLKYPTCSGCGISLFRRIAFCTICGTPTGF